MLMIELWRYSNTTLVKVKSTFADTNFLFITYSNTTLVKVKFYDENELPKGVVEIFKYNTC